MLAHDDDCVVLVCFFLNRRFVSRKKQLEPNKHKKPIRGGGFNEVISERDWNHSLIACRVGKKFLREGHVSFFYAGQLESRISILRNANEWNVLWIATTKCTIRWFMLRLGMRLWAWILLHSEDCRWTHRQVFGGQMLSGHQVGELQVKLGTDSFGGHLNRTAWSRTYK